MDQGPLVTEQMDAGAKLVSEFDNYAPVRAAFWVKESDDDQWFLYLASDRIDDSNFDLAYSEVIRLLGNGPRLWLDPFQVKVIGADDPIAKAVLGHMQKYPGRMPTRYHGRHLGGLSVEEAYIYPIPVSIPS
jgi:hypothetical protein